jgi:hypothetical protein
MLQPKIKILEPIGDYKLKLFYETGEIKIFDVSPYISGEWYEELKNISYFQSVHLIADGKGIEWAHGQDIAPHELYEMSSPVNTPEE